MNDTRQDRKEPSWSWLIAGAITFGVLMGIRGEFESIWIRTMLAVCAFLFFAWTIGRFRAAPKG